jgi:prephenate dehydratase
MSGHLSDPPVAQALEDLKERAQYIKILGSYPRAI